VIVSHELWQSHLGGDTAIVGKRIRLDGRSLLVIGVLPAHALFGNDASFLTPSVIRPSEHHMSRDYNYVVNVVGRLKPGATALQAAEELTLAKSAVRSLYPVFKQKWTVGVLSLHEEIFGDMRPYVLTLLGAVAVVLLIACANVANLLLARALNRRREIAVRLALGISARRLVTQLLTESLMLGALGGIAGLLVAQAGGAFLRAAFIPKSAPASVLGDARTLLFAAFAALVAGVVTGLAPALQLRSVSLTGDLKSGAREGTHQKSRLRLGLLIVQGALSVVLLVGAGLFVRSLDNVRNMRLGYDVDPVLVLNLNMRGVVLDTTQSMLLKEKLLADAKALPEVETASRQTSIPFWSMWSMDLHIAGIDTVAKLGQFDLNGVGPEYFSTLGTRIIRGRGITDADRKGAPGAMVVSARMAKRLWPNADAIGQCVKVDADTVPCTYVVGIAEDIRASKLDAEKDDYYYYLALAQFHPDNGGLFIRTRGTASHVAESIRRRLQADMPGASYLTVTPFSEIIGGQTQSWSLGASMFLAFGVLALALSAIGLFSVISYNVAQRTHELGVRVALGAQMGDLIRLVVSEGMLLGAIGVAIGRWIAPLLFKESPHDPVIFGVVTVVLLTVTLVASFIPARRASRVDPNTALRSD
jgi:putative ABC transport system permease protein